MIDLGTITWYVLLGLAGTIALFWSERGVVNEFAYPVDRSVGGIITLVGVIFMMGWSFAVIGVLVPIPDATDGERAVALGLSGTSLAAILRLHGMSRAFTLGHKLGGVPEVSEILLVFVTLGFGFVILIAGVGDLRPYLGEIQQSADALASGQAISLVLLMGAIIEFVLVELLWFVWKNTPPYAEISQEVVDSQLSGLMMNEQAAVAVEVYLKACKKPYVYSSSDFAHAFRRTHSRADIDRSIRLLKDNGFLVPVLAGGFRRNPHFYRLQLIRAEEQMRMLLLMTEISTADVELMLRSRGSREIEREDLPRAIELYIARLGGERRRDQVLAELLEATLRDIEAAGLAGRNALLSDYLRLRYWEQRTVSIIAERVGYSREHLTRIAHRPAIELFRDFLLARLRRT